MEIPILQYVVYFLSVGALLALICVVHLALQRRRLRRATRTRGFAIADDAPAIHAALPLADQGPGIYRITGVIAASGEDVLLSINAQTLANAKVEAELKGIIVTDIVKAPDVDDQPGSN